MKSVLRAIFGAHGQLAVGLLCTIAAFAAWGYGARMHGEALISFIFHISMFFGVVACYSIIATALGYRATERVETAVVENIEHADEVDVH